jgi:group I intron endonuclease
LQFHLHQKIKKNIIWPVPPKFYSNSDTCKVQILLENQNKSGIYMFQNKINDKRYIGSSEDLRNRMYSYYNNNHLLRNKSMAICCALIKHGYSNFSLTILEYCEVAELLIREKHYWDIFNPEYNIAQDLTAPMSGRTHSDDTKTKISDALKGEKNPMFGNNHSDESKKNNV